ncbi:MAG: hypothetical protein U0931_31725 [Vulcanimicrobiota bacterium]
MQFKFPPGPVSQFRSPGEKAAYQRALSIRSSSTQLAEDLRDTFQSSLEPGADLHFRKTAFAGRDLKGWVEADRNLILSWGRVNYTSWSSRGFLGLGKPRQNYQLSYPGPYLSHWVTEKVKVFGDGSMSYSKSNSTPLEVSLAEDPTYDAQEMTLYQRPAN